MINSLIKLAPLESAPKHCSRIAISHSKPYLGDDLEWASRQVALNGYIGSGEQVRLFETEMAGLHEAAGGVATNSGTAALHLALMALQIGPADEVIIPSYVCTAVMNAVCYVGATPVLADLDELSFNLDPTDVNKRLTDRTKAIIIPHLFGNPADIHSLKKLGIPIIEDCAQALGATIDEQLVGSFGDLAVFSFYATKVITTGYGGMVISKRADWLEMMRDLRDYDEKDNYLPRYNYQMSDLAAAIGRRQLRRLPGFLDRRAELAAFYSDQLTGIADIEPPFTQQGSCHYRYVIRSSRRQALEEIFFRAGIEAKRPVHNPLHHFIGGEYPRTESVHRTALSIPLYPALSETEAMQVMDAIRLGSASHKFMEDASISHRSKQVVATVKV